MASPIRKAFDSLPEPVRRAIASTRDSALLGVEALRDGRRHGKFAAPADAAFHPDLSDRNLEAQITKDYHRIEKGLALSEPKRPFGRAVQGRLEKMLPYADRSSDPTVHAAASRAREALAALKAWNEGGSVDDAVAPPIASDADAIDVAQLESFFTSRHSLRDFDPSRPVDDDVLAHAAVMAGSTPSVCNRQAGRVHVYHDPDTISQLLKLQAGNAGFGHTVPTLIVFTVESGLFAGSGERNQRWIDGSLYAMTYTWALHGLGTQSCMLNWSKRNSHSNAARNVGNIPASEDIICMMAIGYPKSPSARVARSPRRGTDETIRIH